MPDDVNYEPPETRCKSTTELWSGIRDYEFRRNVRAMLVKQWVEEIPYYPWLKQNTSNVPRGEES